MTNYRPGSTGTGTVDVPPPPAPPAATESGREYVVKSGDTLSSISRRHGCGGATALAKANGLRSPYVIRAGQRLRLVGCG